MVLKQRHICGMIAFVAFVLVLIGCGREEAVMKEENAETEDMQQGDQKQDETKEDSDALQKQQAAIEEAVASISVITPSEEDITWIAYSEGFYCYSNDNGDFGYYSENGEKITPCIYSEAAPFSEGLACVCQDGKYGYIGKDGETVLPFIYDQASPFREGVAYFSCGEEYGLIDQEGNVVLELTDCDSISSFREGLAYFSVDGQYGYMDKSGKVVIEPVYDDAGYFYGGRAVVMKDGFIGVIGKGGEEILSSEYTDIRLEDACIIAQKEDIFYIFDQEGNEISSGAWDGIYNGKDMFYIYKNHKDGIVDRNGNVILEPMYDRVRKIPGKELVILENEDGKYGILDYEGQVIVPFIYGCISYEDVTGGLCITDADTGKMGYLDGEDFTVKIPMIYDYLSCFTKDRAIVRLDEKYGVIRYDGMVEMPFQDDKIGLFSDGSMAVWTGESVELTDRYGNLILSGEYDYIREWGNCYETEEENNVKYWDKRGTFLVRDDNYFHHDSVYGAENTIILHDGILLKTENEDEESGKSLEEVFLTNQITPRIAAFVEFLKNGSIITNTAGPELTMHAKDLRQSKRFSKLYRIGDGGKPVLYFYAEPWEQFNFHESYSGFFTVRDGEAKPLITASECGGSIRGDWACIWYDTEKGTYKLGTTGIWGGFPGYGKSEEVYRLKNGQAVPENLFWYLYQEANGFEEDAKLKNPELFYDGENNPQTKESILETETLAEYTMNDKRVSLEDYQAVRERYRYYSPCR